MQHRGARTFTGREFLGKAKFGFIYQPLDMITEIPGQLAPRNFPDNVTEKMDAQCCVRTQKVL